MFKTHTCITVACDGCGDEIENGDGGTAHYLADDPAEKARALDEAEMYDWTILRDGRIYCAATKCQAQVPGCACPEGKVCRYDDCGVDCPCLLHPEPKPVVIPGQLEIGGEGQ